jgi:hypothetical protein
MIMYSSKRNKNVPFGRVKAGVPNGGEITDGAKGIAKRKGYGNGEARGLSAEKMGKE